MTNLPSPPHDLRVNGRRAPLGIETHPRLSWVPGVPEQAAYEIQVGSAPGEADLWASGRVGSARSVAVPYGGPGMSSARTYHWRVRVWDGEGNASPWSESSTWEAGLLDAADWQGAAWIGGRAEQDHDWNDLRTTVRFAGGADATTGLTLLFRAEPVGKTWGEALAWTVGIAPRLDTTLAHPAAAGADTIVVRSASGLRAGAEIVLRDGDTVVGATVADAGPPEVDAEVLFVVAPGQVIVPDETQVRAGDGLVIDGVDVTVGAVVAAFGAKVVTVEPALEPARGARVTRGAQRIRLSGPLGAGLPADAAAFGRPRMRLLMSTRHYAGNTGVPDGSPPVEWGVNYFDSQSETNPVDTGHRVVPIADVDVPGATGLTPSTWGDDHELVVRASGDVVETWINGVPVDLRRLAGDQRRAHGSVGIAARSSATIRSLRVEAPDRRTVDVDLTTGWNPLESGTPTEHGLRIGSVNAMFPVANPAPLLRTSFPVPDRAVARARLYVSAGGQYEVTVDGRPLTIPDPVVGEGLAVPRLVPDHTSFDRTVLYNTYDVTTLVSSGRRIVLAAELGRGWYGVQTPTEWYWHLANYHGAPRLRALLDVAFTDGTHQVVRTGPGWETADGPTRYDSVYSGEKFDARVADALDGWRTCSDQGAWHPATVMIEPGSAPSAGHHGALPATSEVPGFRPATVRAQEHEPVVVVAVRTPAGAFESAPGSGVWVIDFGQVLTGFPRARLDDVVPRAVGATIRMRGGNALSGSGVAEDPWCVEHENNFHDADLQTNYYTVGGARRQSWAPRFSHWGFRYMEVRNLGAVLAEPGEESVAGCFTVEVARNGFTRTGSFRTDSDLLNRIQSNLEWAEQNNLIHKPTDTPSREKNGWSGDAMASSESQLLTWGTGAFFTKYLRDFPDAMISTGQLPMILPAAKGGYGYDRTPGWSACWSAVPSWDAALFVMPSEIVRYTGDPTVLAELYPTQRRLMDYYATLFRPEEDYVYEAPLGEYSAPGDPGSSAVISLQFYVHFADYMARVGADLGEPGVERYQELADHLRRAFIATYWDEDGGRFVGGQIESENVLAIEFDLVPGGDLSTDDPRYLAGSRDLATNRAAAAAAAAESIRDAGNHIQSGVYGARYLFNVLEEFGYTDLLLAAVTVRDAPGFADQIARGATSLWETWTGGSVNHHYRSNVATWFYQELAGIAPEAPGYEEIRIRPRVPARVPVLRSVPEGQGDPGSRGTLDLVDAELRTVRGRVASRWTRSDSTFRLDATIPVNATARVWVPCPAGEPDVLGAARPAGTRHWGGTRYAVFDVPPGTVTFTAPSHS